MVFVGADTGQLRSLADELSRRSGELSGDLVSTISGRLAGNPWQGQDRQQFDHLWNQQLVHQIRKVAVELDQAAKTLRKNADDQDETSGDDGSFTSGGGGPDTGASAGAHASGKSTAEDRPQTYTKQQGEDFERLLAAVKLGATIDGTSADGKALIDAIKAGNLDYGSFTSWLKDVKGMDASTMLSLAGSAITLKELAEAIGNDDPAATLEAALDLAIDGIGIKVPAAGMAWNAGKMIGTTSYEVLQNFYDSPTSALNSAARSVYGSDATWEGLSQEQREILMHRYDGMQGILVSNVDHIVGASHDAASFVGDRARDAGEFIGDRVEDAGRFVDERVQDVKRASEHVAEAVKPGVEAIKKAGGQIVDTAGEAVEGAKTAIGDAKKGLGDLMSKLPHF